MKKLLTVLLNLSTFAVSLATLNCATISVKNSSREHCPSPSPIQWDSSTLCLVQPSGNGARMIRIQNGEILCAFDCDRKIWVRHSADEGRTWGNPVQVAASPGASLTNAELLQLRDGTVLCLYNERPDQPGDEPSAESIPKIPRPEKPFSIWMSRSTSGGIGWQTPAMLFAAGSDPANGCWEPAAIQLHSGEVQVYFANEKPYPDSGEQEITLLRSQDGARTWSAPERVIFREHHRDGMPSPLLLKNKRGIAVAIEDNGWDGHNFKPVIVSTTIRDNWRSGPVDGNADRRWGALAEPLAQRAYAGAPCLRRMPSGQTVLSFQQDDSGDLRNSRMVVCIGDNRARGFGAPSCPFPKTEGIGQLWNSIFVKNKQTVTAISSTVIDGVHGVWAIDGRVLR